MRYIPIKVTGESMSPLYPQNMKLLLDVDETNFLMGDVVVYNQTDKLIIHRVIQIIDNKFVITKGDNNTRADRPIRLKRLLGKIIDTRNEVDKYKVSQYSRLVGIINERYGEKHCFSTLIYILFKQYLKSKIEF